MTKNITMHLERMAKIADSGNFSALSKYTADNNISLDSRDENGFSFLSYMINDEVKNNPDFQSYSLSEGFEGSESDMYHISELIRMQKETFSKKRGTVQTKHQDEQFLPPQMQPAITMPIQLPQQTDNTIDLPIREEMTERRCCDPKILGVYKAERDLKYSLRNEEGKIVLISSEVAHKKYSTELLNYFERSVKSQIDSNLPPK